MSNNKNITLNEFKMWLSGVEEMQEEGWIPSSSQWKIIREKIDQISETSKTEHHSTQINPANAYVPAQHYPMSTSVTLPTPSAQWTNAGQLPSTFTSPETPNIPAKTPNIDTSNGKYQSNFT